MIKPLSRYLLTLAVFFAIDMVWLGVIAVDFYDERIGHLMGPVNWPAALLFYLVYIGGIVFFAVRPALAGTGSQIKTALLQGAVLGFVAYATYDLTNLATLRDWPLDMVVIDLVWGTVLTGAVAGVSTWLCSKFEL